MNLVIDQGNTFTKYGVFDKGELIHFNSCENLDKKYITKIITQYKINQLILSSVKQTYISPRQVSSELNIDQKIKIIILNDKTLLPIIIKYETPKTLGKDRVAALVGASNLYPGDPKVIIDAGTAITIDYLNSNLEFEGGIFLLEFKLDLIRYIKTHNNFRY